jgi:AmmeMemoRadiSam system protein B
VLCKRGIWKSQESSLEQERFINALKKTILERRERTMIIASGDLIHQQQWAANSAFHKKNKEIIDLLKKGKTYAFKQGMILKQYNSCGLMQFYTLLRLLEPSKGVLLNYSWTSNSKFVDKNKAQSMYENLMNIGYASMVFCRRKGHS